jgi:hypothetical protein
MRVRTYTNETAAYEAMRLHNRVVFSARRPELMVLVDGPDEGQFSTMSLREASENEFPYLIAMA